MNEVLLNENVFEATEIFSIDGVINSIQVDLFKNFQNLKKISLNPHHALGIFRQQGIDWIKSINWNVSIDMNDLDSMRNRFPIYKEINFIGKFCTYC